MPSSACDWSSDVCSSDRSEEHTSELQSRSDLVCRLLLEKKKAATEPRHLHFHTATGRPFAQRDSSAKAKAPPRQRADLRRRTPATSADRGPFASDQQASL